MTNLTSHVVGLLWCIELLLGYHGSFRSWDTGVLVAIDQSGLLVLVFPESDERRVLVV